MRELACSGEMKRYFQKLFSDNDHCYVIASQARMKGWDPNTKVEIPRAEDLAARVEEQLSNWDVAGVAEIIRNLSVQHDSREEVSLLVAKEVAKWPSKSREEAIDRAVRVGLSVLTEGILVAPIVGIGGVKIGRNSDGTEYVSLFFNGPIRAAGGTGQAMSVLIADIVRREFGIGTYKPEHGEVERLKEEIPLYKQCQHLQYLPSNEEVELIYNACPVCIDGEKTEDMEISGFRNLPRIKTNCVRGGVCLVISEGMCLKAPKLEKHVKKLGIDGWEFLTEYLKRKKGGKDKEGGPKVAPDYKYLKDIVGGRPVLGHPSKPGGLRLRYGRGRTTGLAALALNPATMYGLDEFLAIGTQIKIERPGKAGAVTPCDQLEGPIVLLRNGDLVQTNTVEELQRVRSQIKEIVDLGEVLLPFGEFAENNHVLVQGDYAIEWYKQELLASAPELPDGWEDPSTFEDALALSKKFSVPLHPKYNLFWYDISMDDLRRLRDSILRSGRMEAGRLSFQPSAEEKVILENLGVLHSCRDGTVVVDRYSMPLLIGLGLSSAEGQIAMVREFEGKDPIVAVSGAMGITVRPRAVTRIGSRMARPEKAKERRMKPPPHVLFPIGKDGGPQRLLDKAVEKGVIKVQIGTRMCPECGNRSISCLCDCGAHTEVREQPEEKPLDVRSMFNEAAQNIKETKVPEKIKCVEGLISKDKTPEPLEKGILRRKHEIFVNKDGTIRFDLTDVPLTHFRPREIGLSIERAIELGYERDAFDQPLTSPEQVCELKVQDIVPSVSCGDFLVNVAKFVDDELTKLYKMQSFYNARTKEDLIGQLTIGLAPHTSGGILCRIIGYTNSSVCYGHPFFHAAKRRNADGDEDSVMLLMDGLLNFSRSYLPDSRGGLMDAPLVLAIRIDPNEIDKEAHNIDVLWEYPLEFYQATMEMKAPKDVQGMMDLVADRVKSLLQYEGFGFTHDTHDISEGPKDSAYKTLGSMADKMNAQLHLARIIRAVDERDTAQRIISKHFLPDLIGNLKQFSGQKVRCTKCGESYRRVPLRGMCYCGNKLTLTVYEASVKKYLAVTKRVGTEFGVSQYTQQRVGILEDSIISIFGNAGPIDDDTTLPSEPTEGEEEVETSNGNGKTSSSTLDSFTTLSIDMVEEAPIIGPEDEKEVVVAVAKATHDEMPLQEPAPKKKKCSLDDYF